MLHLNKNNNKKAHRRKKPNRWKTHRGELSLAVLCFGGIFPETELAWLAWFWAGKEKQSSCTVIKGIWDFGVMLWSSDGASPACKCQVVGWGQGAEPGWAAWAWHCGLATGPCRPLRRALDATGPTGCSSDLTGSNWVWSFLLPFMLLPPRLS